jgi:hypothetical protein
MKLKLKDGLEEAFIYVKFVNRDILGKFIDPELYPYMYNISPDLFDVIIDEPKKTTKNDILINNTEPTSNSNTEGESI